MFCKNCGASLEEGALFCPECGEKQDGMQQAIDVDPSEIKEIPNDVVQPDADSAGNMNDGNELVSTANMKYCHNCGAANANTAEFCYNCGTAFLDLQQNKRVKKSPINGRILFAGLGIVAAVCIVIAVVSIATGFGKAPSLIYIKDNEANVFLKKKPYVVGDNVYENSDAADTISNYMYNHFQTSEDGKYLFYPQDYTDYDGFNLYRKKLSGEKAEEIKVDSSIANYKVLSNDEVIYLKGSSEGKLYYSDLNDKRKIASDVSWFRVSADKKYVMWYTSDGDNKLYVQDIAGKNERIKIDSDIASVYANTDNFDKIVYMKENYLYIMNDFEDKEKISSDVISVNVKDINGELGIYYTVDNDDTVEIALQDIVDDEYAANDAKMKEPNIEDYQKKEVKDSFWGPMESVTTDDSYYNDVEEYEEKLQRDALRNQLEQSMSQDSTEIYYYSGSTGESTLLLEGMITDSYYSDGISAYIYFDPQSIEKMSMGSLMNATYDELENRIQECFISGMKTYLFDESKKIELDMDFEEYHYELMSYQADSEQHRVYFILRDAEGEETYLFSTDYKKGDGSPELMSEDVASIELINSNGVYYVGDADENSGTLYLNGKRIDDDVAVDSVRPYSDNRILYLTDIDKDTYVGTLNFADKTDTTRVSDDVAQFMKNDKGEIAFLIDYNFRKYRGDLKIYKGGKTESIDTDVSTIVGFY